MFNMKQNRKFSIINILFITTLFFCIMNNSFGNKADAAMATGKAKWVGNIWYDGNAPARYADYWNQITPENATKWASCEPQQGVYTFGTAQSMYNYCKSNGIPFKFHTLIWGAQYPSWVNNLSSATRKTEVENWIKTAGQNFPNAEFIDVVNEAMPGHNPPSWRNDIGGDNGLYGTGWDWIVWSFEKARQYFPNSKLLLNDYNVLCDNYSCIDTYITVINILKSRGLIDGIGCQAHGLETVNVANVKSKLDRLGATGLPVYISEMDLNIADDTAQKNKMQELFPVLYEHSAVKGVTLWGYLQGHTWISNSYLLRSDGTERPALTWLKQYLAASSTPAPTPTATSTSGPRSAFTRIEAESFDTQSGIQTESCGEGGQNVGYIENGDYAVYNNIDFGSGAAGFQARVASANSGGNIEIRLDSLTGPLVGTCPVAGTGGWQTWTTNNCSVSGASGTHNLYLKFTGESGYLFNINWFQFTGGSVTTPTPTATSTLIPDNLITNPDFEAGNTNGWTANGGGTIGVSSAEKHNGAYSLLHTGRTATWNGPLQNLTSKVQNGANYNCSGWVRLDNAASASIIMTIKKVDGSGTSYTNIATGTGSNSSWVQLSGSYTLNVSGTLNELSIYFEGPDSGINYYVDDVQVTGATSTLVKVMPLGDSITEGTQVPGGYRIKLWSNTISNGLSMNFVGSQSNGPSELGDRDHEGHPGWRIDQIDASINTWMTNYIPKVVLLHIGTNDVLQNYDVANAPSRLSALIDKICAKLPADGKVYVAKIIPLSNTSQNQSVINFNNQIPGIVQSKVNQGKPVYLVDMYSAVTTADLVDGIHPTLNGYNKMADVWFNAIRNNLN